MTRAVPLATSPVAPQSPALAALLARPTLIFITVATLLLGLIAAISASDMPLSPPNKDIWQHAASLRTLMEATGAPTNPFVATDETSRHFHPLWVTAAAIGRAFDLTVWHVLAGATFASMAVLATGIFTFARAYFASPWAPLILLLTMLFGWSIGLEHTGFHNVQTLLYGAAFPATTAVGLCLLLWACTIRAQHALWALAALVPLAALLFATHQLGAVIAFVGATCLALDWPGIRLRRRIAILAAGLTGAGLALLWPFFNPLGLILQPGNSTWEGGPDFYGPTYLIGALVPAGLGVLGLRDRRARPLAIAGALFALAYLLGLAGVQVASRFLMPLTLILHIGLTSATLAWWANPATDPKRKTHIGVAALGLMTLSLVASLLNADRSKIDATAADIAPYHAALRLTANIPKGSAVAAFGDTAWPVVATGQRVLSVPWPEPGIADLAMRQSQTTALFDPTLTAAARRARAADTGVSVLFIDARMLSATQQARFRAQAHRTTQIGALLRFDLTE